jgi:dipeptidyl aminopeptidase/acylaminoacyl peptidase
MKKTNLVTEYQSAHPLVDKMLKAESFSSPLFNYGKTAFIKRFAEHLPPIHYVARPQLKLGGIRFNPKNYTFISNTYFKKLVLVDVETKKEREIIFPKGSMLREVLWSPDGKWIAVSLEQDLFQEVCLVNAQNLKQIKLSGLFLNSNLSRTVEWITGHQLLLGVRTKNQKNPIAEERQTPTGPVVQESGGIVSQNRTFPDLLKTNEDEASLAHAIEVQLVIYDLKTKKAKALGKPNYYGRVSVSPNGKWILIDTYLRPFSRVVPIGLFARMTEVWSLSGKVVHAFKASGPFENLPIEGVPMGPRSIRWIESEEESLIFAEALDQGDWAVKADFRDELFRLKIGKTKSKKESILKLAQRFAGFDALNEADSYWIIDYERDRQWIRSFWVHKVNGSWMSDLMFSVNENDAYGDPGSPVLFRNEEGRAVIAIDQKSDQKSENEKAIFLSGAGASPEGERPFLRRFVLSTKETETLFHSVHGTYERFAGFLKKDFSEFITAYESQKESPRFLIRKPKENKSRVLFADPNPYQLLSKVKKEVITYERKDGVKLSGILYYPLNYVKGKSYPAILQAYPLEYTDAATAGQVRGSQDQFWTPYHDDMIYNTLNGYFVLDEAQMPIIGHPETKNDTFIEQLVTSAEAAVDALVKRVNVDPKRVGVVGHSYGAYMVANLLTHSSLFSAGVAKSGAYNRTLTPFGFQGERRPLWKAKETYLKMSPFLEVDKVKTPILLIHGMADNNMGTFPMQSERYFDALKGQGVVARMVLLPEESHGYTSRESIGHVMHEVFSWFDRFLKANQ